MWLLVLKVLLAPVIVLAATAVQRRWGPAIGGRLVGLPLTAGPLLVLLAVANGPRFTAHVAVADQAGDVAATVWCVVYLLVTRRVRPLAAFGVASAAFAAVALILSQVHTTVLTATLLASAALVAALVWLPRSPTPVVAPARAGSDLGLRMLVAAGFTFALSESAARVGAHDAGLLGALPLVTIVLAVATHYRQGPVAAQQFLHGVMAGSFSVIAFLAVLPVALPALGTGAAFALGLGAALVAQLGGRRKRRPVGAASTPATPEPRCLSEQGRRCPTLV
jgi:hypothetical protein